MAAEHQISAFPATKQQEEYCDEGQCEAIWNDRRGALLIAREEIVKFDQDYEHIRTRMPPDSRELTNLLIAENVDQAHDGREGRHHKTGSEKPGCRSRPCRIARLPIDQIANECTD